MTATVRQAILSLLRQEWNPNLVGGWDVRAEWGADNRVYAHIGEYDDSMDEPQMTLVDISAQERSGGVSGWKSDGSGVVQVFDVRIQLDAWADEQVSDAPDLLSQSLAEQAREIVHGTETLFDSDGNPISTNFLPMSRPRVIPNPEDTPTGFQGTFDIGVRLNEEPP